MSPRLGWRSKGTDWNDRPVLIIGGGPSLTGYDFSRLGNTNAWVIGVNQAMFDAPCHMGVTCDSMFVSKRDAVLEIFAKDHDLVIATGGEEYIEGANHLERRLGGSLSDDVDAINTGGTSGYMALNVAYHKHPKKIILLGYDYGGNAAHYHDEYEWYSPQGDQPCWKFWASYYETCLPQLERRGIRVVNLSPTSSIQCFEKRPLTDLDLVLSDGN